MTKAQLKMLFQINEMDAYLIAKERTYQERKGELRMFALNLVGQPNGIAANQPRRLAA